MAERVAEIYKAKGSPLEIVDLHKLPPEIFAPSSYAEKPVSFAPFQETLTKASGVVVVTPEYNGGFPGVFKYFIDMLEFPATFKGKPFAFVGLSGGRRRRGAADRTILDAGDVSARYQLSGQRQYPGDQRALG